MNIFIIPSIYPSNDHLLSGIYIKEQVECLARNHPEINFGVCLWGQNEVKNQLWGKQVFKNISKIWKSFKRKASTQKVQKNLTIYYQPRFYWSKKILKGNIGSIIQACFINLKNFEKDYGSCSLLHAHVSYPAGFIANQISRKRNVPYVITEHMTRLAYENALTEVVPVSKKAKRAFLEADSVIAVSDFLKKELLKYKVREITMIHNLTDESIFVPDTVNKEKGTYQLLSISNILHSKGLYDLLDTIARVKRVIPNIKLKIIGSGKDMAFYKQRAKKLKIEHLLEWVGHVSRKELIKQIQYCDLFMMTSYHETFGQVFAEAIACGKPILCTRCGGPEEIVNKVNGVLANKKDSVDSAKKLIYLIENLEKYDPAKIRKDFEKRFSSKVITPKIVNVYKDTIHGAK